MFARLSRRRRSLAVLLAFATAIAGLVATASPASAGTCQRGTEDNSVAVFLGEDPAVPNVISIVNGDVIVDGTNCGVPEGLVVMDFTPTAAADKQVVINANESWQGLFVVMLLESVNENPVGAEYDLVVNLSDADESIRFIDGDTGLIQVFREGDDVPHLQLGVLADPIDLTMNLRDGDDEFNLANGFDNDLILGLQVSGNEGDDTIFGTSLDDVLKGGKGADDIRGRGGADTIRGQSGADVLRGGGGPDDVRGGTGSDTVYGNSGSDDVYGNSGSDTLRGGTGSDFIHGGRGEDDIKGNSGNDTFKANDGFVDTVSGGPGTDSCAGCDDDDNVTGSVENP